MRTLLLTPAMFSSEGGIERMMRLYLKALCDDASGDDQVDLVSLNDTEIPEDRLEAYAGPALRKVTAASGKRLVFAWQAVRAALSCDRIVAGHFHLLPVVDLACRFKPGLKAYMVAHGTEIWRPWKTREQRQARRSATFLAVSEFTRAKILGRCPGLEPSRVHVVPNTMDPTVAHPLSQPVDREQGLILAVSRLSAADNYKGIDHLIQAMPAVLRQHPHAHLRVVGKGDDRERLEALAAEHAPDRVEFTGFLPDEVMAAEYARAQIFVLPSRDEGFGLVYLEAFIQGTPCVVASAGAAPELVTPESGRCAIFGDVANLAEVLTDALHQRWDPAAVKARAEEYSYPVFRAKLRHALSR
jgi:glycosyltransferase involved in cell wall biosynthesis